MGSTRSKINGHRLMSTEISAYRPIRDRRPERRGYHWSNQNCSAVKSTAMGSSPPPLATHGGATNPSGRTSPAQSQLPLWCAKLKGNRCYTKVRQCEQARGTFHLQSRCRNPKRRRDAAPRRRDYTGEKFTPWCESTHSIADVDGFLSRRRPSSDTPRRRKPVVEEIHRRRRSFYPSGTRWRDGGNGSLGIRPRGYQVHGAEAL
jgi:hypothetical protein